LFVRFQKFIILALSEKDQSHREELKKIKEQSLKAINDLDGLMEEKDREFKKKIDSLNNQLKLANEGKSM